VCIDPGCSGKKQEAAEKGARSGGKGAAKRPPTRGRKAKKE
jgi:hypothetical protein